MSLISVSRGQSALSTTSGNYTSAPSSRPNTSIGTINQFKNTHYRAATPIDRPK
jgi:hypothetical protein